MKKFFLNKNNIIVVFGNVAISDTLHNPLFDNTEFVTNMMRFMNMEETPENEEALKAYLLPLINSDFQIAQQNEVRKEQLMNVEGCFGCKVGELELSVGVANHRGIPTAKQHDRELQSYYGWCSRFCCSSIVRGCCKSSDCFYGCWCCWFKTTNRRR